MKKLQSDFVKTLQQRALQQSKLHTNQIMPSPLRPLMTIIGDFPWQSLFVLSFVIAWIVFLIWFEFFYSIVHNIV